MSTERASAPPGPERTGRAHLVRLERSEGEAADIRFVALRAKRGVMV